MSKKIGSLLARTLGKTYDEERPLDGANSFKPPPDERWLDVTTWRRRYWSVALTLTVVVLILLIAASNLMTRNNHSNANAHPPEATTVAVTSTTSGTSGTSGTNGAAPSLLLAYGRI